MKKIVTTCALFIAMSIFAQQAGKVGELLENEATKGEMQTPRVENIKRNKAEVFEDSNNRILGQNQARKNNDGKERHRNPNPVYQWNQNFGYSEVFLRIPEQGYFTVEIGEQMMSNSSGKYRFFDLQAGRMPISIYQDGYLVYRTKITIQNNRRLVLDFFTEKGLYLLDVYPVQNQSYGLNNWDDVWNTPYGNFQNNGYYGNIMNDTSFYNFMNSIKKNSFDTEKTEMIKLQAKNTHFTSEQIKLLLDSIDFDRNRIEVAKMLYHHCIDRNNFYRVYDVFDFTSSKKEVMRYVSSV